ncbi:hypothetical protein RB5966 [Rhodopirellula baltica SH 1]|uniref:Uncharacterized protein n=1 Tax=Rhodopirellula baltica (strain DSM 10527 / NCIMB 13988 / SH1) TaxID=243090 RepID=Q7UR08_RHOBA|nr:hypothetical protein RB5966 [Rhodopirellula baltica SH 1]
MLAASLAGEPAGTGTTGGILWLAKSLGTIWSFIAGILRDIVVEMWNPTSHFEPGCLRVPKGHQSLRFRTLSSPQSPRNQYHRSTQPSSDPEFVGDQELRHPDFDSNGSKTLDERSVRHNRNLPRKTCHRTPVHLTWLCGL